MFRSGIGCCSSASLVNSSIPHSVEQSGTEQKRNGESFVVAKVDHGAEVVIVPAPPLEQPPLSSLPPASATVLADQQQQHPHPKRNYASKDCGAKVLYSNAEAENRGAILNDPERDDYMRNPCERAQNKFLIIELCETIQPTALEIANFELFSSSPRQFRLWGAERYPTQEWALIGEFEALDNREVQLFNVLEQTSYAKFVKLELITHYGTEHYCTLSTFRLYGTSMVDEYEAETVAVVDPLQQQHHQQQLDSVFGRTFTNSATLNDETMVVGDEEENNRRSSNNNTTTTTGSTTTTTNHRPTDRPSVAQRCRKCLQNNILQCDWFCHVFFGPHQPQRMTELSMSNLVDSSSISALPIAKMPKSHLMEFLNRISPICPLNGNIQGAAKEQTETKKQTTDGQNQELNQQQQHQTVQQPQRPMLDTKIVDKSNLTPLPGTSSSHKESVFMKLNKRLTALEQNMSLSSEHLLELSRRCVNGAARAESELKQQREGISKEAERMAKQEANRVETEMKQKISELQHEVRRLSQQLQSVQTTVVQATGTGGFFYRPMLSRVHGYSASDSYCRGDQACLVTDAMMGTTLSSMHSTSAASYGVNSMPVPAIHPAFEGKTMDGLWTTSQVIYLMLLVQLGTLVMLKLFRVLSVRVLHQCFYAAAQPLSTMHSATTPLSSTPMASSANLTDTMMNTSQQSLPLLNSSTLS